ncbi:MAG TPA: hypothetical protein VFN43_03615, partial [Humibacillus sp.]|nr:hypothetical protein [Humibacillus sp.]
MTAQTSTEAVDRAAASAAAASDAPGPADASRLPRPTTRQWLALGVLALTALLLSLDVSVLYLALPELSADLGAST